MTAQCYQVSYWNIELNVKKFTGRPKQNFLTSENDDGIRNYMFQDKMRRRTKFYNNVSMALSCRSHYFQVEGQQKLTFLTHTRMGARARALTNASRKLSK